MYSSFIRVLLALIGLSPILLSLYIVNFIQRYKQISISIKFSSINDFWRGLTIFLRTNYLLILFIAAVVLAHLMVKYAKNKLAIGRIEVKSIKPGDNNFFTLLFSIIVPFARFYNPTLSDKYYMAFFFAVAIIYGLVMKASYHFNIVLKLFLNYTHYEIATTGEVTYLLLSKRKIVNKLQVTKYVYLTDHMLVDVSDKP